MTPKEQRIAIAKACGWIDIQLAQDEADNDKLSPVGLRNPRSCLHERIPDYLNDLNACHEMEKQAPEGYAMALRRVVAKPIRCLPSDVCDEYLIFATAQQRCEAFLRTLNLWTE
jgi:hypothetical protein